MKSLQIEAAGNTRIGVNKSENEDAFYYNIVKRKEGHAGVFVVCDGVGGLQNGAETSKQVVSAIKQWWVQEYSDEMTISTCVETLQNSVDRVNTRVIERAKQAQTASTIVSLVLLDGKYILVNAGDSRAYKLTKQFFSNFKQLSTDHTTTVSTQTESGVRKKRVLTECVGYKESISCAVTQGDISTKDTFLLCSDGIYKTINDNTLQKILTSSKTIADANEALFTLTAQNNEKDDVTAIIVQVM